MLLFCMILVFCKKNCKNKKYNDNNYCQFLHGNFSTQTITTPLNIHYLITIQESGSVSSNLKAL